MQEKQTVLDLFSGIGGFSLGLERAGFETIAFCEIESFCQKVLQNHWPDVPVAQDIRQLRYENGELYDAERLIYQGRINLICGGFPCQPFSVAGRKRGTEDHRDLWPEMFRIIQQAQPDWIIGENVANFTNLAFTRTKTDLESEGYTVQPFIIPACAVGAPHRRDRVWIVAYRNSSTTQQTGCGEGTGREETATLQTPQQGRTRQAVFNNGCTSVPGINDANTNQKGLERCIKRTANRLQPTDYVFTPFWNGHYYELPQPIICRGDDGFSSRVDRLKSLGNSVVPQIPEIIGQAIINSIKD